MCDRLFEKVRVTTTSIAAMGNSSCVGINRLASSKTILNYWRMVERYPNLKEEVGGSIPGCEISSHLTKNFVRWSPTSYALAPACRPSVSKIIIKLSCIVETSKNLPL